MCLTIPASINPPKALIAKEDIVCYKLLRKYYDGRIISPFQNIPYTLNELVNIKKIEVIRRIGSTTIHAGLHSFGRQEDAFVCATHIFGMFEVFDYLVYKAIIPKGSKYYVGKFDCFNECYVSDALFVTDEICA